MNYFAHARPFLDQPYFMAGTGVPDWLTVVDRRVRLRAKHAEAGLRLAFFGHLLIGHFCRERILWNYLEDDKLMVRLNQVMVLLPAKSPNLNAHLERFHRSLKEECLERTSFFGEASLRNAVRPPRRKSRDSAAFKPPLSKALMLGRVFWPHALL
jgi:hypothetical protein